MTREPTATPDEGEVVRQTTKDWDPAPVSVAWPDVLAALEAIRRENAHGFGVVETVKEGDDERERPWLNAPFLDAATGRSLGAGSGVLVPVTLAWDGATKTIGGGDGPRRTSPALAAFGAFAVAHGGRLEREVLTRFVAREEGVPAEGAVSGLVAVNAGAWVKTENVRRGDLLQIEWKDGGTTPAWCWDVHHDGKDLWVQILSAQASTGGVGVLVDPEALAAVGKLEPVQRHGQTSRHLVHRAERGSPWLETRKARAFYRAHGHWLRVPASEGDRVGIERLHVGRLHGAFPCYPIALEGSHEVSSDQPPELPAEGPPPPPRTRARTTALYHANNEGTRETPRKGGFFPVGASRSWHGGVHLYPEKDPTVVAPIDGIVVAARLATAANKSRFGDVGFVLVKTRLKIDEKEVAFFTLLANLGSWKPDAPEPEWFAPFAALPAEDDPVWDAGLDRKKTRYRVLPVPADPSERRGADAKDGGLHVYEKRDRGSKPGARTIPVGAIVEAVERLSAHGWAKVKTKDGLQGFVYGLGRLARIDVAALDPALRKKRASFAKGEVVDLCDLERPIVVRAGEAVGFVGDANGEPAVHVEIFSDALVGMNGKTKADIEDADASSFTDRARFDEVFFEQLDATDEGGQGEATSIRSFMLGRVKHEDDHASAGDVCGFYAGNVLRAKMRTLITRHVSAWSDGIDWKKLDGAPAFAHVPGSAKQAFRDEAAKLVFWKKGSLAKAGLPQGQIVHHYHPITFLAWLDELRENDDGALHESLYELNHGKLG